MNIHREYLENYNEISLWSLSDYNRLLRISHDPEKIAAYDFFNCKCNLESRKHMKHWFGHKSRRFNCAKCPKVDDHLATLYMITISLQYIYFLFSSVGVIWLESQNTFQTVTSAMFCLTCTVWVLSMWWTSKSWISCIHHQSIFIIVGSLALASSFHVNVVDLLISIAVTQVLSYHLYKSKTDGGYKSTLLVSLLNLHYVVTIQWITFILPSFVLLAIAFAILPFTMKQENNIMHPGDYPATILSFIFFNTIWMLLLAVIQHSEEKLGVLIPHSFLTWSDIEYWTHCFLMPIVSVQILIRLEASNHESKNLGTNRQFLYKWKHWFTVVSSALFFLVLMTLWKMSTTFESIYGYIEYIEKVRTYSV